MLKDLQCSSESPVVVTGASRSGKSLVARILASTGEFAYLREPLGLWGVSSARSRDHVISSTVGMDDVVAAIRMRCASHTKGKRYLDDSAYHAIRIPLLRRVFPDVQVIYMYRDFEKALPEIMDFWLTRPPIMKSFRKHRRTLTWKAFPGLMGVFAKNWVSSVIKGRRATCGPVVPGLHEFAKSRSLIETVSYQWAQIQKLARSELELLPETQWMCVDFDKLLEEPQDTIRGICEWLGVTDPESTSDEGSKLILRGGPDQQPSLKDEEFLLATKVVTSVLGPLDHWEGPCREGAESVGESGPI